MHLHPHRVVATTHVCIQIRRGQWEIDMGRIWYMSLSLSLYMSVHKLFVHAVGAWLNDVPFSYEELYSLESLRSDGLMYLYCGRIYVLRKPSWPRNLGISWSWRKGVGKNQWSANPTRINGVTNEKGHRLTLQLTLVFPIVRRWIIVSGWIFPFLIRARRACRGFIFFPCLNAA